MCFIICGRAAVEQLLISFKQFSLTHCYLSPNIKTNIQKLTKSQEISLCLSNEKN